MDQVPVRLGPLALLLTVISICLTTLAILTFTTSGADLTLARKYAETVHSRYALEEEGQTLYAERKAAGNAALMDETLEDDGFLLHIKTDAAGNITEWRHEKEWQEDSSIGNLWGGW